MTLQEQKTAQRKDLLVWRRHLTPAFRNQASEQILARLYATEAFQQAHTVFAYASTEDEVQLDGLLTHCLTLGKRVCIPQIIGPGLMVAAELQSLDELEVGKFGIRSLQTGVISVVAPEEIDLVIVPGAGFTVAGARLGLGGGYYDRYLPKLTRASRIALVFDGQVQADVPMEPHDQYVDSIITERRSLDCHAAEEPVAATGR